MRKVILRFEITPVLKYVIEHGGVIDNSTDDIVECDAILVIDGKYHALINNLVCEILEVEGEPRAFKETAFILSPDYCLRSTCINYNDKLSLAGQNYGYIDEYYEFYDDGDESWHNNDYDETINRIEEQLQDDSLSDIDRLALMQEKYDVESIDI